MRAVGEVATGALSTGAEEFLSWLSVERGRSPRTIEAYRRDLIEYERFLRLSGQVPSEASPEDVLAYRNRLRDGHSPASTARALSAIRGLQRFLHDEGMAARDPTDDVEPVQLGHRLPKALSEADVERLLGTLIGREALGLRDRALLELLYGTGARISEVVGLDLTDVGGRRGCCVSTERGERSGSCRSDAAHSVPYPTGSMSRAVLRWHRHAGADAAMRRPSFSTPGVGG